MSKFLFISPLDIEKKESDGVSKKIFLQINTLIELGHEVSYIYNKNNKIIRKK